MASSPVPILDHIVLLVPHDRLVSLPAWVTDAFTVLTGGRHADGVTENKLILFQDGVYIEIIAFVPGKEEERKSHKWGSRLEGHIVDWATTLRGSSPLAAEEGKEGSRLEPEDAFRIIQERVKAAETGIEYSDLVPGGRITPAGTELKWSTSSPAFSQTRSADGFIGGELPFWCLDRTPRPLRVPHHIPQNVEHPSQASGVHAVSVFIKDRALFESASKTYAALYGEAGQEVTSSEGHKTREWALQVPETSRKAKRVFSLILYEPLPSSPKTPDVFVKLSLFSSSGARKIQGTFVDDWPLTIDLVSPV